MLFLTTKYRYLLFRLYVLIARSQLGKSECNGTIGISHDGNFRCALGTRA
jgi:hypothetical protein